MKLFARHSERNAQVVERLNQGDHILAKENVRRYIDILQDSASKYNASHHRSIKMATTDVRKITKVKSG